MQHFTINQSPKSSIPTQINEIKKKLMKSFTSMFSITRRPYPNQESDASERGSETPAVEGTASSGDGEIKVSGDNGSDSEGEETTAQTTSSDDGDRERPSMHNKPPEDDVCPICFGNFDVPCRASCGHWYCGGCILQYWNFGAALQPCKCPMCSQQITKLIPEPSLCDRREVKISKVLRNVGEYNRLFVGGISGLVLKFRSCPLYIKRMFREMLNADRPGVYLNEMRIVALLLGILYSLIPYDFLRIGRRNIVDVFDYSAFAISFILYLVGTYHRRRRMRNVRRELALIQAAPEELMH